MTIAPRASILVGATLLGLCIAAGVLAGYPMEQEILIARIDQAKGIAAMAPNMALELKRQVDTGLAKVRAA